MAVISGVVTDSAGGVTPIAFSLDASGNLISSIQNADAVGITHAAASVGVTSGDQTNKTGKGIQVYVDITVLTGTAPTLTVFIEAKDPNSGKYFVLLQSTALAAVASTLLSVYPGGAATANIAATLSLPKTWRIRTVIGGTSPAVTATIGSCVVI